ncbi:porin family protein [Plesiomonas shigelloides]|uniref:porin family protein n=1 Tax=Plesiomonas shigelloides TaxID=703 RepID=UPI0015B62335|nr:porin family protein [Plesiomonas shigelloides]
MPAWLVLVFFPLNVIANGASYLERDDTDMLIRMAQGKMQESQWDEAIYILKKGVAKYPKNNVLRLQLAVSLFKNKNFEDSLVQLLRVKSIEKNKIIVSRIDNYIEAIRGKRRISYHMSFSYESDDNVYSVPKKNIGKWRFQSPLKDNYLNYYLSASNVSPVYKGVGIRVDGYVYGKKYRKYDEFDRNVSVFKIGPVYNNGHFMAYVQSGLELYKSNEKERKVLLSAYASSLLGKNKKVDFFIESKIGKSNHKELLGSLGGFYFISPWSYLHSSLGFRFERYGRRLIQKDFFNFHWGYDWDIGISTVVGGSVSYQNGNYRDIFGVRPKAVEIAPDITIWYRDFSFLEFVPKLKISYLESNSKHPLYNFNKMTYSVFVSKSI